jgi:hypothetical protein
VQFFLLCGAKLCNISKNKKKALPSKRKTSFKCFFNPLFSSSIPGLGTLQKSKNRDEMELGDVIGCGIGDDLMDNFNDPRKTLKYQFSFFPHRFSTNFTTMQSFATKKKIG